jgi:uncharacterized protein YndB with AHSA1/START domain
MPTTIITPDQDSIVTQIEIAAPPERVFQALTDAQQLKRWFGGPECPAKVWEMDAGPGGHYRYVTEKGAVVVNNVSQFECHGEIVEYDPPRVLAYTWIANWHDDLTSRTIVRWELTPKSTGTLVKVTHSGLTRLPIARRDYTGGWPGVLEMLKKFAEDKNS